MNARIRALLWEELWVGGPIGAALLGVGLITNLAFRLQFHSGVNCWHKEQDMILFFTLGIPLVMGLLVILNTANTGHLSGGFSKRILRLPVDTWSTVASVLLARLFLVFVVGAASVGLCRLLFQNGPGIRAAFLIALVYLFIQVMDWSRGVTLAFVPLGLIGAVAFLAVRVGSVGQWTSALASEANVTPEFLTSFVLCAFVAYGASYVLVRQTRCGERLAVLNLPSTDDALPWMRDVRRKPFVSPLAAQIWYEQKRAGLFFPAMTALFWFVLMAIRWLVLYFSHDRSNSPLKWLERYMDPMWALEVFPFIALIFAAFAWLLKMNRSEAGKGRPYGFRQRLPLRKEQMAQARLLVSGMNLGICLAVITVISLVSFLFRDNEFCLQVIRSLMARGETDLREVAAMMLGMPITVGLFLWFLMCPSAVRVRWMFAVSGFCVFLAAVAVLSSHGDDLFGTVGVASTAFIFGFVVYYFVLGVCRFLTGWRRGLISKSSLLISVAIWALFTALFFPFALRGEDVWDWAVLLVSVTVAGTLASAYVNAVTAFAYREWEEGIISENPRQHTRDVGKRGIGRVAVALCGVVGFAFLAWMRWPAESRWEQARHAQGLPARVEELDGWYPAVPDGKNVANLYLKAWKAMENRGNEWKETERKSLAAGERVDDKILITGGAYLIEGQPIPEDVWAATKRYWEMVGRETAEELHAAAGLGLTESRYPVDLRHIWSVDLEHLSKLRAVARILALEALIASVEGRPDDAVAAVSDMVPLADSLKMEPVIISQLVRIAIIGIAAEAVENSVNRGSFSDEQLARFSEVLAKSLPPVEKERILDRALIAEETNIRFAVSPRYLLKMDTSLEKTPGGRVLYQALLPVLEFSDFTGFAQTLCGYKFERVRERAKTEAENRTGDVFYKEDDRWLKHVGVSGVMLAVVLPAIERTYESEWRVRMNLDMAVTGVAVERFRMAEGKLPERLEELAPKYLDEVPRDMYNEGKPISYRVDDDGGFVVYSWGRNERDDRGLMREEEKNKGCDDMGFRVK